MNLKGLFAKMINKPATRILPHSMTKGGKNTSRGEHLLPQLSEITKPGFVGVKTGKIYELGAVSYLGKDLTPSMMMEGYCKNNPAPKDRKCALKRLIAYTEALKNCKIGNVISITYSEHGLPILHIEKEFLLSEPNKKLP
jgi:hypothetical protein